MLRRLAVRNLAVIPELAIEFGPGLTVITGESGAGKSVLLDALGLALGARATSDRIRPGAKQAEASAEFDIVAGGECEQLLDEHALLDVDEPNGCATRRTLDREGRSRAFVNDQSVTRRTLAAVGDALVDIHAQFENVRLARREVQLDLLDDYGVPATARTKLSDAWREWRQAIARIAELESQAGGDSERRALAEYQLAELAELNPQPGEYEEIAAEHTRLSQVEELREVVGRAVTVVESNDALRTAATELNGVTDTDSHLASARSNVDTALSLLDDALGDLRQYAERLEADPARAAELDQRLARLHEVARKHRVGPAELPELHARLAGEAASQQSQLEQLAELQEQVAELAKKFQQQAAVVSKARRKAAKSFGQEVGKCMRTLGIDGGTFEVNFTDAESEHGLESVEFCITTHPDRPPAPLAKIASGGEQARVSLAIAVVAARKSALPCLVLDEADIGVGGVTADTLGRMLRTLADRTQVICVTHAPQVAALGGSHLRVSRGDAGDTRITALSAEERVEEIARMLSGAGVTDRARANAQELLQGGAK